MEPEPLVELAAFIQFDSKFYSELFGVTPDEALAHFLGFGLWEDHVVRPFLMDDLAASVAFDAEEYRNLNADVRDAAVDPWHHFLHFGLREFRATIKDELGEGELWDALQINDWRSLTFSEKIARLESFDLALLAVVVKANLLSPGKVFYKNTTARLLAKACFQLEWPVIAAAFLRKYREGLAFCVPGDFAPQNVTQVCQAMRLQAYCEGRNITYSLIDSMQNEDGSSGSGIIARLDRSIVAGDGSVRTEDHILLTDVCWSSSIESSLSATVGPRHRAITVSRNPRAMSGEFLSLLRAGSSGTIDCVVDALPRLITVFDNFARLQSELAIIDIEKESTEVHPAKNHDIVADIIDSAGGTIVSQVELEIPRPTEIGPIRRFLNRIRLATPFYTSSDLAPSTSPGLASSPEHLPVGGGDPAEFEEESASAPDSPGITEDRPLICLVSPLHRDMLSVFAQHLHDAFEVDFLLEVLSESDCRAESLFVTSAICNRPSTSRYPPFSGQLHKLKRLLSKHEALPTGSGILLRSDDPSVSGIANGLEVDHNFRDLGIERIVPDWRRGNDLIAAVSQAPMIAVGSSSDAAALVFASSDVSIFLLGLRVNEFEVIRTLVNPAAARVYIVAGIVANEAIGVDESISYIDPKDLQLSLKSTFGEDVFAALFQSKVQKIVARLCTLESTEMLDFLKKEGRRLHRSSSAFGRPCISTELDESCFSLGAVHSAAQSAYLPFRPRVRTYYATEIYKIGGHTRLIEEFIAALPDDEHHVICSSLPDLEAGWELHKILRSKIPYSLHVVPVDLNMRLAAATAILAEVRSETFFHLAHPDDPVGAALFQPANADQFVLVHHNDHSFSLGPSHPGLTHVTVHPRSKRDVESFIGRNTIYIPMTSSDGPPIHWSGSEPFLTATSGSQAKFSPHDGRRYVDLLKIRFSAQEGRHIHIGPLDSNFLTALETELTANGMGGRFTHIAFAENLSEIFRKLRPHLYLNSYPIGGGHTLVDAMAVGLPIAAGKYNSNFDSSEIPYVGHISWRHLYELQVALQSFTEVERSRHHELALECFHTLHAPDLFRRGVRSIVSPHYDVELQSQL